MSQSLVRRTSKKAATLALVGALGSSVWLPSAQAAAPVWDIQGHNVSVSSVSSQVCEWRVDLTIRHGAATRVDVEIWDSAPIADVWYEARIKGVGVDSVAVFLQQPAGLASPSFRVGLWGHHHFLMDVEQFGTSLNC